MLSDNTVSMFKGPTTDAVLQRQAIQELHHDEGLAFVLSNLVDGADVGMVEGGSCTGFAAETFQ
jgi:hypothetical protein